MSDPLVVWPETHLYSATKAALESLTRSMALQLGECQKQSRVWCEMTELHDRPEIQNHRQCRQSRTGQDRYVSLLSMPDLLSRADGLMCRLRWSETSGADALDQQIKATPAAPRIAEVQDIAPIVAFLCEEQSRWVTGNVTCANGGMLMH